MSSSISSKSSLSSSTQCGFPLAVKASLFRLYLSQCEFFKSSEEVATIICMWTKLEWLDNILSILQTDYQDFYTRSDMASRKPIILSWFWNSITCLCCPWGFQHLLTFSPPLQPRIKEEAVKIQLLVEETCSCPSPLSHTSNLQPGITKSDWRMKI